LESIREAGVVHVVEKQKGIPDDAADLRRLLALDTTLKKTIYALQRRIDEQKEVVALPLDPSVDGAGVLAEYERLIAEDEQLTIKKQNLQREIDNMKIWGDFDLEILNKFEKSGRQIKFYSCREREFHADWFEKHNAVEVVTKGGVVYFITVTPLGSGEEPEADKMRLSHYSLGFLETSFRENENQAIDIQKQLDTMAVAHLNNLKEMQRQLFENIDLNKVHLQAEKTVADKLILLEGWAPEIKEQELIRALESQDVYYIAEKPAKDDKSTPILLKNNKFARLFEPIAELYEFPNYQEMDITPFFAPFYMLFFGVCLGDAGYGLLILLATLFARSKVGPALKPIMSLASVLGAMTVFCGFVSGTLFGIPLLDMEWAWLTSFKQFMFDSNQMFTVALILGGVQIIFGMFVKAYKRILRYGWAYSIETWGWIILLITGVIVFFAPKKGILPPDVARYLTYGIFGIAALFIFVLNTPGRNPLINIGAGLWNTFNMATGLLGDVLSYIRLFALGLCGSVMGFVFNQLAMQLSGNTPVVSQLIMIFILVFGHSLNIFMSGLGAFVHPMRLTFVEFYKNAEFEGGGKPYKPFKYIAAKN
jgi:V/A-type H+-transporting ATPase subunit I